MTNSTTPTVFIDTSVLFSALLSSTGASAEILRFARDGKIKLLVSEYVIDETRRVLKLKAPHLLPIFEQILTKIVTVLPDPKKKEVENAEKMISDLDDAPILASAMKAKVDYLITLDRKDFINDPKVAAKSKLAIITPGALVKMLKS